MCRKQLFFCEKIVKKVWCYEYLLYLCNPQLWDNCAYLIENKTVKTYRQCYNQRKLSSEGSRKAA